MIDAEINKVIENALFSWFIWVTTTSFWVSMIALKYNKTNNAAFEKIRALEEALGSSDRIKVKKL